MYVLARKKQFGRAGFSLRDVVVVVVVLSRFQEDKSQSYKINFILIKFKFSQYFLDSA